MAFSGNEVAATNELRRNDELSKAPVGEMIATGISVAGPVTTLSTSLAAHGPTGLAIAGSVVAGLGIVEWFRKLGSSKVHENLDALGQATEDALNRVEKILQEHGTTIEEIMRRLESSDFRDAMASASLQALRTTQLDRLKRLALILANSVEADDLEPESLDDMMRAAVELTEKDLLELGVFCFRQTKILAAAKSSPMQWHENVRNDWQQRTIANSVAFRERRLSYLDHIGSCPRLAAFGFIVAISPRGTSNSPEETPYALLPKGKQFYERLQVIAAE